MVFSGIVLISDLKNIDLEDYQSGRESQGVKPATIDMELSIAQTMVNKAFDNDKIDGKPLKAFRRTKKSWLKAPMPEIGRYRLANIIS